MKTKLKWQRPAIDTKALGLKRCKCGEVCALEYTQTDQTEPDAFTLWTPLCGKCKADRDNDEKWERGSILPEILMLGAVLFSLVFGGIHYARKSDAAVDRWAAAQGWRP